MLAPTLLRNREYRPNTLRGLLGDASISVQSFTAAYHKLRRGHQLSPETLSTHPETASQH